METIKESKDILKRFLERRRNIRKEMTKLGRVFDSITMIFMFFMLIIMSFSIFSFGAFELGFGSLVLIFIIILPFALIVSRINNKASKKYKAKIKEQRLKFCVYCGGKLDSFQNFCPYCDKKFDESVKIITQTTEIQKDLGEEYDKKEKALSEQKEIFNISRKSFYKTILITAIIFPWVLYLLISILANNFSLYPIFLLVSLVMIVAVWPIGYFINVMFIYSRFLISAEDIKLYIEKNLFFQVNWSEINKIDIYRVRFHGHLLKINYANTYKIISLEYCEFSKKKQKEIINSLFQFSDDLKDKISVMKTSATIVDEVGKKDLYEEIYQFARAQRFVFRKSID
jgi:ABC-type multidrug transport system fused ATPase/permease subunit